MSEGALKYDNDDLLMFLRYVEVERERQIQKGFTAEHDDGHTYEELSEFAAYILTGDESDEGWTKDKAVHVCTKYSHDRKRQLVIAAALVAAEYERLCREEKAEETKKTLSPEQALAKIRALAITAKSRAMNEKGYSPRDVYFAAEEVIHLFELCGVE